MKKIFNILFAPVRFLLFVLWILPNAIFVLFVPTGSRLGLWALRFFMNGVMLIAGIRIKVHGQLSKKRPLLVVGNHISVFEMVTFPVAFGGSFFGKKEIESYPLVGWMCKKFGVIFIDRRPSHALEGIEKLRKEMAKADYPMFLFPEGTTTSGTYVLPFKSTLFNFMENGEDVTVQPVVQFYRYRDGSMIPDQIMADDYAFFDNCKMTQPPYCKVERNLIGQIFHVFSIGGFMVEVFILPPPPLAGKDRKEIATELHKIINDEFKKLK
ncbi:MAG: 1-acyl-sn-glycerol-3-phosphate acyltransferase [Alphaproteobacteria bacterium]|nr:1-acyl-sn-glycerol-3-phosphate acyltransferase [Alphaproteobacteria bacterium]